MAARSLLIGRAHFARCNEERNLTIRERIRHLQIEQFALVVFVAVVGAGLLLSARRVVASDGRKYTDLARELRERIDSLYGDGYLDRRLSRLTGIHESSGNRLADSVRSDVASRDEKYDSASARLVVLYLENVPKRDATTLGVILADILIALVIVLLMSVVWIRFGRMRRSLTPRGSGAVR